jgi:hypothetical protein
MQTQTVAPCSEDSLTFPSSQVGYLSCDPNYAIALMTQALTNLPYTAGFEPRAIEPQDADRLSKMTRVELLELIMQGTGLLQDADEAITAYYRRQNPEDYTGEK